MAITLPVMNPRILAVLLFALPAAAADLTVVLRGVDARRPGHLECALYAAADGFPGQPEKAAATARASGEGDERICVFRGLSPGPYAVAAMHDENGNGKLDTNFFGVPTEGWATSNNVTHAMHAPDFAESKFLVAAGGARVDLQLHY